MEVLKTTSPSAASRRPRRVPSKRRPSSRRRKAGVDRVNSRERKEHLA
jgi:hypothetical protein